MDSGQSQATDQGCPPNASQPQRLPTSWFSAQMALGTLLTLLGQRQNQERGVQEIAGALWAPVSAPGHPELGPGSLGWGAPHAHAYRSPAGLAHPRVHTCRWKQDGSEPVAPCPGTRITLDSEPPLNFRWFSSTALAGLTTTSGPLREAGPAA